MSFKRIRIPNQDVKLDETELDLIHTKTFQRLFAMKQLGLAYLVYPGATHTRAFHSIRCLLEAQRILDAIGADQPDANIVRTAALLHDLSHVPFSHTLEDEHAILERHDRPERLHLALDSIASEISGLAKNRLEAARPTLEILAARESTGHDWKSDLVGNTVCADLLAYITTDAEATGIEKRPGYYRIYDYFSKSHGRLCLRLTKGGLRSDIVSAILDLLDMRFALTERVLFHHAKATASAMLARASRLAGLREEPELLTLGDERFFLYLRAKAEQRRSDGASRLLDSLESRHLYCRVFKLTKSARDAWDEGRGEGEFCKRWRDPIVIENTLQRIEALHRLPQGSLVVWCPDHDASMKLAEVLVLWDSDKEIRGPAQLRSGEVGRAFPGVHARVRTIEEQYEGLWTFWIALDRVHMGDAASIVRSIEEEVGVECDPVFRSTYLSRFPRYVESHDLAVAIEGRLKVLRPETQQVLQSQAAAADGSVVAPSETGLIDATILEVAKRSQKKTGADVGKKDPSLFDSNSERSEE